MEVRFPWIRRYNALDTEAPIIPKLLQDSGQRIIDADQKLESMSLREVVSEGEILIQKITKKAIRREDTYWDTRELLTLISSFARYIKRSSSLTGIVEWLVKYGNENIRCEVVTLLKPDLECMSRSKHCVGCVLSLLENSTQPLRDKIIRALLGSIVRLINHPVSSPVVDLAYTKYAGSTMKILMKQELYGQTVKSIRDEPVNYLNQALGRLPSQRDDIMRATESNLKQITEVGRGITYSIFHEVLFEYLRECDPHEKNEMIFSLANISPMVFLNSKEGSYVLLAVMESDRTEVKLPILDCVLPHTIRLATNVESYLFTIAICFSLNKFKTYHEALSEMFVDHSYELAQNRFGSCILLYLLAPHETLYLRERENESLSDIIVQEKIMEHGCLWEKALLDRTRELLLVELIKRVPLWTVNEYSLKVTERLLREGSGKILGCAFRSLSSHIVDLVLSRKKISIRESLQEFIMNLIEEDLRRDDDDFKFSYVFITSLNLEHLLKLKKTIVGWNILRKIIQYGSSDVIEMIYSIIENGNLKPYLTSKSIELKS